MTRIKIIKKPWGEERLFALCGKYAGKLIIIRKGHRLSLQYHKFKEETFYILEGMLRCRFGPKKGPMKCRILKPGGILHLPPLTIHRSEALEDTRMIEVSTPELSDIVRLQDDYHRKLIGAGKK